MSEYDDLVKSINFWAETQKNGELITSQLLHIENEKLKQQLAAYKEVVEAGLIKKGNREPYKVSMCNTFHPESAIDRDVTLCVDITDAISKLKEME